jgi:hypothetical protein
MQKKIIAAPVLAGLILGSMAFASCATAGGADYAELAAQGVDVFAGKNWNAPRRNNMYDRWEFSADGAFHFWHVHHGEPLDRGVYRYEVKHGIFTAVKEGTGETASYTYAFSGKTVALTPAAQGSGGHGAPEHNVAEHSQAASGERHGMGALPEAPVIFTEDRQGNLHV